MMTDWSLKIQRVEQENCTNFILQNSKITCQIWHRPLHSAHFPCVK